VQEKMSVDFLSNTDTKLLIDGIKRRFTVDLSGYSTMSFQRRINVFFANHNIEDTSDFLQRLEKENKLLKFFLKDITVEETEMFRDPEFWIFFANNILIDLLSRKEKITIWMPESTSGEDFYSLAIILYEKSFNNRVNVIVSSNSELNLSSIKDGIYTPKKMEHNKQNYFRYKGFETDFMSYCNDIGNKYQMNADLKTNTELLLLNSIPSKSPKNIDVVICRNKFLYYTSECKEKLLNVYSASLNKGGFLAIGIKESISETRPDFKIYNENEQIYIKK